MARPNASIPLSVKPFDLASPLIAIGESRRQEQRQSAVTQSNLKTANLQQENLQGQIDTRNQQSKEAQNLGLLRSVVVDFQTGKDLMDGADFKNGSTVLLSTLERIDQLGLPSKDIENILSKWKENPQEASAALDGIITGAKAMLGSAMAQAGVAQGADFTLAKGAKRLTAGGELIAENVEPAVEANNQVVQLTFPDGTSGTGSFDPKTLDVFDSSGNKIEDTAGIRFSGSTITGSNDEVIAPSIVANLNKDKIFTQNLVNNLVDMKRLIQQDPNSATIAGDVASFVANIKADARGLSESIGFEFDETLFDVSKYESEFKTLGIDSAVLKSIATGAAYSLAAKQNAGRVSNPDFKAALLQIGGNLSDPVARIAVIDSVIARETRSFEQNFRNIMDEDFTGDFGVTAEPADLTTLSDEELLTF